MDMNAEILILLGRDILRVHKVPKQCNGPDDAPYAQKLLHQTPEKVTKIVYIILFPFLDFHFFLLIGTAATRLIMPYSINHFYAQYS